MRASASVTHYNVIYADPPWAWSKTPLVDRGNARAVEKEYPTMQPGEIASLPIHELAAPDSVLFLWATGPKLPVAIAVMSAWGFEYKTIGFVWIKKNRKSPSLFTGMGFYTRANAELCLIGTRGRGRPRKSASVHQVVDETQELDAGTPISMTPISTHSTKPEEVAVRISLLYEGPYLELFARGYRPGWDVWGNQVTTGVPL